MSREQRMLHAVAFASETLLRAHDWRERVDPVLRQLGEATEMSRVYLFHNRIEDGRVLTTQIHEWTAPGVEPQLGRPELVDLPMAEAGYGRWVDLLGRSEVIAGRIDEFPDQEREFLVAQSICAIAVAPVHVHERWWGFLGFDDCTTGRTWSREEREILATTARILGAAIERTEQEDQQQARVEERLRIAIEGARVGTFDFFPLDGSIIRSERAREILGIEAYSTDFFGDFERVVHPDDRDRVDFALGRALDPGDGDGDGDGKYAAEFRVVRPDGSIRWVAARGQATFEERDGRRVATRLSGIILDQTEQVLNVQAVQENAEKLRAIFDGAAIGIALVDGQGNLVDTNAALEEMFGRTAAELQEIGVAGVSHPDDLERDFALFQELIEGRRQTYRIEKRYIHKNGEVRWGRLSVSRVKLQSGVHAVAMVEDITERALAAERLAASEERFRILAERVREVFYVTETDPLRVTYVSPGYEDVWQQSCDALYENPSAYLEAIHPDDRPRVIAAFERQHRGEETVEEYRVVRLDGSTRWVRDRAFPIVHQGRLRVVGLAEDVTDRHAADEEIRRTQERYELIARATKDIIWDWDLLTDHLTWNESITVTLGYDRATIRDHVDWWYEHVHPDDRQRVVGGIHAAIESGASAWQDEYRFARADGTHAVMLDRGYIGRDGDGRAVRMIGAMVDLTDRLQAEAELRARDLRYRSLVESSTQIVWTTDERGEIDDMPVWRALTGQTREEVRGAGWLDAIHPEDRERTRLTWEHAYQTRSIYDAEYRIRMRDGSYRWFAARGIPVIDEDGTLREWVGTCGDVDERKRSESALTFLADASATLATSLDLETTLRRIAALAVPRLADWCVVDLRTEESYERLAAEHRDPEKRNLAWELWRRYGPSPDRADPIRDVLQSGQPLLLEQISEELLRDNARDDEHLRILEALGLRSAITVPLAVGAGSPIGAITFVSAESGRTYTETDLAVADDLARRAALAIENARLYRAAQEANRAKDEFLATLSHELRTPLTAILGWSKLLSEDPGDRELLGQGLETIQRSAVAQARLIDDVLDVSRIISGKLRLEMQPVDVEAVVDASVEAVTPAAQAKEIALRVLHEAPHTLVFADPNRLQQVVWNLLANAIKFTPIGGRVEARTHAAGDMAVITVADSGQGIAPEFLPHVFEPFRQAESAITRVHGGLGLGLAIVRYLVESHGGRVAAYSEGVGRGAQFTIELPLRAALERTPAPPREAAQSGDLHGVRVLFVDDQEDTRFFADIALRRQGAVVTTAQSVEEATGALARAEYDVIVTDIAMPGRDGYALLAHIRNDLRRRVPVIAMTAFGRTEDVERAQRAGFAGYIRKPVAPQELAEQIEAVLRAR